MKLHELLHENEIVSDWKFLEHEQDNLRIYYKGDKADSSRNYVFYVFGVSYEEYISGGSWNEKTEIYIVFSGYGNWESLIGLTYGNGENDAAMTIYSLRCALDLIEKIEEDFKL